MPRKKRHKFKFDEQSVNLLLQEIYDDSRVMKAKIIRLFNKWDRFVTEGGEIAAIGGEISKLINAEAKNLDQKIMILKFLKEVVYMENKDGGSSESPEKDITQEEKDALLDMIANEVMKKERHSEKEKK